MKEEVTENLTVAFMTYLIEISGFSPNTALKSPILSPKCSQKATRNLTLTRSHHAALS